MALPNLQPLDADVRQRIQERYAAVQQGAGGREADPVRAYGELGKILLAYGYLEQAEPALANARDLAPGDARWSYYLAHLYRLDGKPDRAAAAYEDALRLNADVPTRVRLAEVYRDLDRTAESRRLLGEALGQDSSCAYAHFLLGQILADAGDARSAAGHYEAALRLQPDAASLHYLLALTYRALGDEQGSEAHLAQRGSMQVQLREPLVEEIETLKEGPGVFLARGSQLMRIGQVREAAEAFERAVAADPGNAQALLKLGTARAELGEPQAAAAALERALRFDPSNEEAHYNLALLRVRGGDLQSAEEHFRVAVRLDPGNSKSRLGLAELLRNTGRCAEAIQHFASLISAAPEYSEGRLSMAMCEVQAGNYAGAKSVLEAGHQAYPNHPGLNDALARVLAASPDAGVRDGPLALELAQRQTASNSRAETLETLAMAYAEAGQFQHAIDAQSESLRFVRAGNNPAYLLHLEANLRRYQQGEPCRTPWPDFFLRSAVRR